VRPPSVFRGVAVFALVAYCCFLAVVLLAPTSSDQSRAAAVLVDLGRQAGFARYANQVRAEFIANALILMPVSALGSLVWTRTNWRDWTAWGFLLAGCVELAQGLALAARTASFTDVVANTLGAMGGALFVAVLRWPGAVYERR
jgi:glycopeptide antibiotics resistance protein